MRKTVLILISSLLLTSLSGCVFRANIAQGNIVEQEDVEQLEVGMTRNQIRFLLGSPMIDDPFDRDRWDYVYYVKIGRKDTIGKYWLSVIFEDGLVSEIRKDQELAENL